jgi:mono/diheme cytochrome c family protein
MKRSALRITLALVALLFAGCGNMKKQDYLRAEEPSPQLPRGTSAQLPPPHTVPHAHAVADVAELTGERDGQLVAEIPLPLTPELLARGRERFEIYCAVCHGPDGYGRGLVVQRGFPAPPSYHDARLRNAPAGHFFRVITRGYGLMYSYADRLSVEDRWAVVAYIRALQLNQHARVGDLAAADRARLSPP